jgi:hypothetical protein
LPAALNFGWPFSVRTPTVAHEPWRLVRIPARLKRKNHHIHPTHQSNWQFETLKKFWKALLKHILCHVHKDFVGRTLTWFPGAGQSEDHRICW